MKNEISLGFINESLHQFKDSLKRLFHCIDQLDEEGIWWRPNEQMNSVAVLVKHVCGNMREWTVTAINNTEDKRNRPAEFLNDKRITKQELISLTRNLDLDFIDAITNLDAARLTEERRIQGYEVTLMGAIFHALTHLEGHTGQIVLLTRWQLGDRYKILWLPQSKEQMAAWQANE